MEKAKISAYQLFALMILFEIGSTMLLPLATEARQDAWIAALIGMLGSIIFFLVFYRLYVYYPNDLPTVYVQKLIGKWPGRALAFIYLIYFIYLASVITAELGHMLVTIYYSRTPYWALVLPLILVIFYTVRQGIEVVSRTAEIFLVLVVFLFVSGMVFIISSGLVNVQNVRPILGSGIGPVIKVVATQTVYIPFGELVVFAMIFPYVNDQKKVRRTGLLALITGGIIFAFIKFINISVLGVDLEVRSQFPLLSTLQTLQTVHVFGRLDFYFILLLIIDCFFKAAIIFYVGVISSASIFHVKKQAKLSIPIGMIVLIASTIILNHFAAHTRFGLHVLPLVLHLPLQGIIPFLLLIIAMFKNRRGKEEKQEA